MNDHTPLAGAFSWGTLRNLVVFLLGVIALLIGLAIGLNWALDYELIPKAHAETGIASWYSTESCRNRHVCRTANGERFTGRDMTAAHRTLPFGTRVKVCIAKRGTCVVVRINDRGPASWTGRSIDLAREPARRLGITGRGTARVRIEVLQ